MGLLLTLLYLVTAYISPQAVFGSLAEFHLQIIIAVVTLLFSLLSARGSEVFGMPQAYAIIGLGAAIFFSLVFNGWIGGGPVALMDFLPNGVVFFFVALNCKSKRHMQYVVVALAFAAFFTIYRAWFALQSGDFHSPYLISQTVGEANAIYRIRGLAFISDPNDLAQFLAALIPMIFLFWTKERTARNLLLVYLPVSLLIGGMFLTHSRGGMLALMVMAVVAGHRKIGATLSMVGGAVLFVGLSAVGWSGGREVSAASGADRMEAWSVGLGLIRQHPVFGVGFNRFTDYYEITAHNTVVVCAAELGLTGLFFWILLVMPTIRDAVTASKDWKLKGAEVSDGLQYKALDVGKFPWLAPAKGLHGKVPIPLAAPKRVLMPISPRLPVASSQDLPIEEEEIRRIARLLLVSLAGFLTAGWFLSRAYTMTLFVVCGMMAVTYRMAWSRELVPSRLSLPRAMKLSAIFCVILLSVVYVILRADHLLPH